MPRRPAPTVLAAALAASLVAAAGCSTAGGSMAGLGATSSPSARASTSTSSPSASPTSPPATASAAQTKALFARAVAARAKVRYVQAQSNYTYQDERVFSEVDTMDYGVTPYRLRARVTFAKRVIDTIVEQNGDVYALGLISNMPTMWVRLRPHGKDGISVAFKAFGDQMRANTAQDPVKAMDALVLQRGLVPAGTNQILDEPVRVYRGELDVSRTLTNAKLDPRLREALKDVQGEQAYLEVQIDSAGMIRSLVQNFGPTTLEVSTRPFGDSHAFDLPPAAKIASPSRIKIVHKPAAGGSTRS